MRTKQQPAIRVEVQASRPKTHEECRKELWVATAIAVANSSNCNKTTSPAFWADTVLQDFDKRFPQ